MGTEKDEYKTVKLRKSTKLLLDSIGRKGDTYDAILKRMLTCCKKECPNISECMNGEWRKEREKQKT